MGWYFRQNSIAARHLNKNSFHLHLYTCVYDIISYIYCTNIHLPTYVYIFSFFRQKTCFFFLNFYCTLIQTISPHFLQPNHRRSTVNVRSENFAKEGPTEFNEQYPTASERPWVDIGLVRCGREGWIFPTKTKVEGVIFL